MPDYVITSLDEARPKGWFELSIEGKPPFLIDAETIFRHSLRAGEIVDETKLLKIKDEADVSWLKYKATKILASRMISERDLRRKLSEEKRPNSAREDVIAQLKHYGMLDDLKYATSLIRTQMAFGPKSKLFLKKKLREKGVDDQTAESAITGEFEGFDEVSAVREIARKKYKTVKYLPAEKAKGRVINFLRSRGFQWDIIKKAIDGLFTATDDSEYI